jgi:hypothetical protein
MFTLFGELRALDQCVSRYTVDTNPHLLMALISNCFPFTLIAHISKLMFYWPRACTSVGRRLIPKEMYCGQCTEAFFAHHFSST